MSFDVDTAIERELEREAVTRLDAAIQIIADDLHWYWRWGDGNGGFVLEKLREAIVDRGYKWPLDPSDTRRPKKDKISRTLSRQVFERDAYRCVACGSHLDLTCDHIIPESKGGATAFDNLQTMCRPCNSKKGAREE